MRLTAFEQPGEPSLSVVRNGHVAPLCRVEDFYRDVDRWLALASQVTPGPLDVNQVAHAVPVPRTAKVLCVGLNYRTHAAEASLELPPAPNIFARWTTTLIPTGTSVPVPAGEPGLDWEGELGVIVGRRLHDATPEQASNAILGYTCFNDISARTFQTAVDQWALGKNADRSGPIGPVIATPDEVGDADSLLLETRVNGETVQSAKTGQMIFKPYEILAYASRCLTLEPGDVLATGTPEGVGFLRTPPRLMGPGDEVEVEIEKVGVLRNRIVSRSDLPGDD